MALTPREEAMHLEVRLLKSFKPSTAEERYIYTQALDEFFSQHTTVILDILDKHLTNKYRS